MKGTRTYDYEDVMVLEDVENEISTQIVFNPDRKGWFKRMFSHAQKTHPDFFEGIICNQRDFDYKANRGGDLEKLKKKTGLDVYAKIEGNWTESMRIDDVEVWNYDRYRPLKLHYINNPLPSDGRFRPDLIALLNHDLPKAQEKKDELEEIQRNDRKLRKNAAGK